MGEKDISEKMLADYNDVFADIVNVLLFNGKCIIRENELQNTKDRSQYKADGMMHEQVHMFRSDFGIVAEYFVKTTKDPLHYAPERKNIRHVNEILKLMKVLTGDSRYEDVANELVKKGGAVTMCEVLERVELKGREEGRFKLLIELVSDGTITIQKAAETAGMDEATFREKMKELI